MDKLDKNKTGSVVSINSNLLEVEFDNKATQNEICFIELNNMKLMGEVIKIQGNIAFVQVFENTNGLKIGSKVQFTGNQLSVTVGPGLLSSNFDGLQNDLHKMEGILLKRGDYNHPLDTQKLWKYSPIAKVGDVLTSGEFLAEVDEKGFSHKIMIPFNLEGNYTVEHIASEGEYTIETIIAKIKDEKGDLHEISMVQTCPVKIPILSYNQKLRPQKILETGIRMMDILCPMLEGGTGFIPGPFGCGKTVLQHLMSKQANVDIVIVAACGERANEVVEIFTEFPELDDPRTGKKLMERTVIIANTSNMPVASREASVYTAMTIAEYYRAMGLKVLLLADSTSRWAQALREMSNRLEELPGPDAFPVDLSATIANYYSRAGMVELKNKQYGSITFIGTVSPAGGNLKEPVTESTKKVARCFYALSQQRADSKRYPAIDPVDSYSKYLEYPEFVKTSQEDLAQDWIPTIKNIKTYLNKGMEAYEQINILGDDGVPIEYHVDFWKSELIDFTMLQQDAFDKIDCFTSLERQKYLIALLVKILNKNFEFKNFEDVSVTYKKYINIIKQLNYTKFQSDNFKKIESEINNMLE